jgi:hypothetical protein
MHWGDEEKPTSLLDVAKDGISGELSDRPNRPFLTREEALEETAAGNQRRLDDGAKIENEWCVTVEFGQPIGSRSFQNEMEDGKVMHITTTYPMRIVPITSEERSQHLIATAEPVGRD